MSRGRLLELIRVIIIFYVFAYLGTVAPGMVYGTREVPEWIVISLAVVGGIWAFSQMALDVATAATDWIDSITTPVEGNESNEK